MADFMVGHASAGKDRFKVGWNESKESRSAYKVGRSDGQMAQGNNKQLGGGDQDPVVGSKSNFEHKGDNEKTYKDIGDRSEAGNFGGSTASDGETNRRVGPGGEIELCYSLTDNYSEKKDAIARRKAQADAARDYMKSGDRYDSPVPQVDAK